MTPAIQDRARGALLGLAVGDALGATLEFTVRDALPHHTEMIGRGPFHLDPGVWTDDTSMALALADSLVAHPRLDPTDLMNRFTNWWRFGQYSPTGECFDIGITTRAALERYQATGNPLAGSTEENVAGNGSLMRLAPVALQAWDEPDACRRLAAGQSRTTHGAPQCVEACIFFADLLRRAIGGEAKPSLLAPVAWCGHATMVEIASGASWRGQPREKIRSSGYVIHTLQAALWAVDRTTGFEEAVVLAVNLADDSDTVGAVTGQLAGALYGANAIPPRWLAPLAWRERIVAMADALLKRP
jgi:ADP-ribosyl-[dinitrogen reductase] hydrolase